MYCLWKYSKFLSFLLFHEILETGEDFVPFWFLLCLFCCTVFKLSFKRAEKGIKYESCITNWPAILQGFHASKLFFGCQQNLATFQKLSKFRLIPEVLTHSSCIYTGIYTTISTKVPTPPGLRAAPNSRLLISKQDFDIKPCKTVASDQVRD